MNISCSASSSVTLSTPFDMEGQYKIKFMRKSCLETSYVSSWMRYSLVNVGKVHGTKCPNQLSRNTGHVFGSFTPI